MCIRDSTNVIPTRITPGSGARAAHGTLPFGTRVGPGGMEQMARYSSMGPYSLMARTKATGAPYEVVHPFLSFMCNVAMYVPQPGGGPAVSAHFGGDGGPPAGVFGFPGGAHAVSAGAHHHAGRHHGPPGFPVGAFLRKGMPIMRRDGNVGIGLAKKPNLGGNRNGNSGVIIDLESGEVQVQSTASNTGGDNKLAEKNTRNAKSADKKTALSGRMEAKRQQKLQRLLSKLKDAPRFEFLGDIKMCSSCRFVAEDSDKKKSLDFLCARCTTLKRQKELLDNRKAVKQDQVNESGGKRGLSLIHI
eukprot:TRINITY_DN5614_c0_g1_i2.p2 TRINITY_DN5614_c0_g1~~TRINITY_DN5614_c0_g1_i2.p2  ORF type:complete len:303 (-),score=30.91 TRINITY_DN5614_c0_g1_i2:4-912(-)